MEKHYFLIFGRFLYLFVLGFAAYVAYQIEGATSWVFWSVIAFMIITVVMLALTVKLRKQGQK
ncbi:hypothetical protein [Bacillus sp. REN10]|uniref:hypothetical protein n=1 Tax=Bacillus sp. REN10 TaxID=2782541 RepID=UPI00193B1A76|nr:hypothetical protein [Bacillus sp. REN10]